MMIWQDRNMLGCFKVFYVKLCVHSLVDKLKWFYENARCYNKIYNAVQFTVCVSKAGDHHCTGTTMTRISWPKCTGNDTPTSSTSKDLQRRRNPPQRTLPPTSTNPTCSCPATTIPPSWTSWAHMQASLRRQVSSLACLPKHQMLREFKLFHSL